MIYGGYVLINHNSGIKTDALTIEETEGAVAEIANRRFLDLNKERRLSIAQEFVESNYDFFLIESDGSLKFPIDMLESWILEKIDPINA